MIFNFFFSFTKNLLWKFEKVLNFGKMSWNKDVLFSYVNINTHTRYDKKKDYIFAN